MVPVLQVDRQETRRQLARATRWLTREVHLLRDARAERSTGGPNDFYSEGDYWWPNPADRGGPYIRRDGESNPDCFNSHRKYLMDMALCVAHCAAAYGITMRREFADKADDVLRRWFVEPSTAMTPNLEHAQAIKGVCDGRGIGIIDTIHLAECTLAVLRLEELAALPNATVDGVKHWFSNYLRWLKESPNGQDERCHPNNHGACWYLQVAAFALLCGNRLTVEECGRAFEEFLLPMMDDRGAFPAELARTKPFGYSCFQMDVMAALATLLSWGGDNWFVRADNAGHNLERAMLFLYPFLLDKSKWPFQQDVMHWDEQPNRPISLLFCGFHLQKTEYIELWRRLPWRSRPWELLRNSPVRVPQLWGKRMD